MSAGRKYCTPKEKREIARDQNLKCACGCGEPIAEERDGVIIILKGTEWDHSTVNKFKPGKPDQALTKACHAKKTAKDKGKIAKVNRILGVTQSQWADNRKHHRPINGRKQMPSRKIEGWRDFKGNPVHREKKADPV